MTTANGVDILTVLMMVMGGILGGFIGYRITRGTPRERTVKPELKLCPHCGGRAAIARVGALCRVVCAVCDARTLATTDPPAAVAAWNRRA